MAAISDILFVHPLALLALASIIPLIILYLLRPRSIHLRVPSIIFFLKHEQKHNRLSLLLRRLIRDPLFLIQLLVLILLSFAMAAPYIMEEHVSGQHTVIVIDNSASMQAGGRLEEAKELASGRSSTVNSVVWAQQVPVLALREGDSSRAREIIALTPQRAISSDLAAAITFGERIAGPGGTVIVFSDFAGWSGDDPLVAKGLAEYNGVRVEFVQVGEESDNIGITSGWIAIEDGNYVLNLAVRNFNERDRAVSVNIQTGSVTKSTGFTIPARSTIATRASDLEAGVSTISLVDGGSLEIDDTVHVYIPAAAAGGILLVDTRKDTSIKAALGLLPVSVEHTASLPTDLSSYGMVILGRIDNRSSGPQLEEFVENGGALIVTASPEIMSFDAGLLPVMITGISNEVDVEKLVNDPLIEGVPIADVEVVKYLKGSAPQGAIVPVEASDGSPLLSYWKRGEGRVVYLGLNDVTGDDAWSGFSTLPEFPLFWKNAITSLGGTDIDEYNVKTGTAVKLPSSQTVIYPDGTTSTTANLWVDQAGIYRIGPQVMAANLYDAGESDVNDFSLDMGNITSKYVERPDIIRTDVRRDLSPELIWAILGLLLLELIIIQRRRELF